MGKEYEKKIFFLTSLTLIQYKLKLIQQIKLSYILISNPQSPIKYPQSPVNHQHYILIFHRGDGAQYHHHLGF